MPVVVADSDSRFDKLRRLDGNIVGFDYAAVLWDLPGHIVLRSARPQPAPASEFAVQNR